MNLLLRSLTLVHREFQNSLRGGSVSLFAGMMVANVFAYGYHMLLARIMSPADYGVLVTLTSISYVLAVLARTFQAWIIKAVCTCSDRSGGGVHAVFGLAMRTVMPLGAVIFLAHWLASRWIADFFHLQSQIPVILLGTYAFTSFLTPVPRGVLLGLNRLHMAGMIYPLESVARVLAAIVLVTWGLGVNGAVASYALGDLLAFVIALLLVSPLMRIQSDSTASVKTFGALDRYAVLVLITNVLLMIMASVDQIAIKHFFSDQVAGNYGVAFLLGRIIALSTMALGWTIFARAAHFPADDPRQARLLIKGLVVTALIASSLTLGYITLPTLAIRFMAGAQYEIAHAYVGLVGVEMTIFAFVYIQAYFLMSLKQMHIIWPLLAAVGVELLLLSQYHATVEQILWNLIMVMAGLCCYITALSWWTLRAPTSAQYLPSLSLSGPAVIKKLEE